MELKEHIYKGNKMNAPTIKRNANNELRQLSPDNLKSVFGNLINTSNPHVFWEFFEHVFELKPEIASEYLIAKLLNDCHEKEILEETQDYL